MNKLKRCIEDKVSHIKTEKEASDFLGILNAVLESTDVKIHITGFDMRYKVLPAPMKGYYHKVNKVKFITVSSSLDPAERIDVLVKLLHAQAEDKETKFIAITDTGTRKVIDIQLDNQEEIYNV